MSRKYKWLLLGLCLVAVAAWIVLVSGIARKNPKKTATDETKVTQNVTQNGTPGAMQPVTTEDGMVTVWLLERVYLSYDRSKTELQKSFRYDGNGRLVSGSDSTMGEVTYEYDDENHLIKAISERQSWGEATRNETVYRSNGLITASSDYVIQDNGEEVLVYEEIHDEAGRTVSVIYCDNDGTLFEGRKNQYDKNGLTTLMMLYSLDKGDWIVTEEGQCDDEGRVTKQYFVEGEGDSAVKTLHAEYIYNDDGSREEIFYQNGKSITRKTDANGRTIYAESIAGPLIENDYSCYDYTETEDGLTVVEKFYSGGTYQYTLTTRYNSDGNIIFEKRTNSDGTEVLICEWTYDENGSLIKYDDGVTTKIDFDDYGNRIRETVSGTSSYAIGVDPIDLLFVYEYKAITIPRKTAEENAMFFDPTRLH